MAWHKLISKTLSTVWLAHEGPISYHSRPSQHELQSPRGEDDIRSSVSGVRQRLINAVSGFVRGHFTPVCLESLMLSQSITKPMRERDVPFSPVCVLMFCLFMVAWLQCVRVSPKESVRSTVGFLTIIIVYRRNNYISLIITTES